uniref:Glycosyl transferase 64 domain-containing protein n=1 Tax=Fibrocapsa japonica TaxID=94617 RepID=A0A7S2Y3B8_9STRA|mmetsp:Transcript_4785/g.7161  ORF Transcript_4785/g.7161 Transcript_4785/m.7161 type:complete len:793 (+) Transcript_4785:69-2447(+)
MNHLKVTFTIFILLLCSHVRFSVVASKVEAELPSYTNLDILFEGHGSPLKDLIPIAQEIAKYAQTRERHNVKTKLLQETRDMQTHQYNLRDLLQMPSDFDYKRRFSNTTVILNHWKRNSLSVQLDAMLAQNVRPAAVWVCAFNSPQEKYYQKVVNNYRQSFANASVELSFIASSFNFKYYGRFQLALRAKTRYVWIVDDDIIPGPKFLAALTHTAGIKQFRGAALGSIGWIMPKLVETSRYFPSYRTPTDRGGLYFPDLRWDIKSDILYEADLLCSQWFLQVDSVKLLFRERWVTYQTGEDYFLAYSLRRYANAPSYIMPMDLEDPATWGNVDIVNGFASGNATTTGTMIDVRNDLWHGLVARGGKYQFLLQRQKLREGDQGDGRTSVLVVIDGAGQAKAMDKLMMALNAGQRSGTCDFYMAMTGGSRGSCRSITEEIGYSRRQRARICKGGVFGFFDLNFGGDFPRDTRSSDVYSDILFRLGEVLNMTTPLDLVVSLTHEPSGGEHVDAVHSAVEKAVSDAGVVHIKMDSPASLQAYGLLPKLGKRNVAHWDSLHFAVIVSHFPQTGGASSGAQQLKKLLSGLESAAYLGASVDLVVVIASHAKDEGKEVARRFQWSHGSVRVVQKLAPCAPEQAVLEAWTPTSHQHYAMVVSSDHQVSPGYFLGLKLHAIQVAAATSGVGMAGMMGGMGMGKGGQGGPPSEVVFCLEQSCAPTAAAYSALAWSALQRGCAGQLALRRGPCSLNDPLLRKTHLTVDSSVLATTNENATFKNTDVYKYLKALVDTKGRLRTG